MPRRGFNKNTVAAFYTIRHGDKQNTLNIERSRLFFLGRGGRWGREETAKANSLHSNIEIKCNFISSELQVKRQTNTRTFCQSLITTINCDCSTVNVGTLQPSLVIFKTNNRPASFARVRRTLLNKITEKWNPLQWMLLSEMFHPPWNSISAQKKAIHTKNQSIHTRTRYKM